MNYTQKDSSQKETADSTAADEVRESAAVAYASPYAVGGGGRAAVRPWAPPEADDEFDEDALLGLDGGDLDESDFDDDPEFRASVLRRADEVMARIAAGEKGHTTDEVCDRILRCIETGNWDYYGFKSK
jgi:hypothetical protein